MKYAFHGPRRRDGVEPSLWRDGLSPFDPRRLDGAPERNRSEGA